MDRAITGEVSMTRATNEPPSARVAPKLVFISAAYEGLKSRHLGSDFAFYSTATIPGTFIAGQREILRPRIGNTFLVIAIKQHIGERVLHARQTVIEPEGVSVAVGDAAAAFGNQWYVAPRVLGDECDTIEDLG